MGKDVHSHYDDKICNPDAQRYTTRKFQVIKLYLSLWNGIWLTLISIDYGFSYYAEDGHRLFSNKLLILKQCYGGGKLEFYE